MSRPARQAAPLPLQPASGRAGGAAWTRGLRRAVPAILLCLALAPSISARPASAQADCSRVSIRSPFAGDTRSGRVEILGSAQIEDFQFYKLEWAPEGEADSWRAVSSTIDRPLRNGLLDSWDTSGLPDGVYRLKLTVVDQQSNEACRALVEPLWLANQAPPEPTASPTPQPSPTALPRERSPEATREPAAEDAADEDAAAEDAAAEDPVGDPVEDPADDPAEAEPPSEASGEATAEVEDAPSDAAPEADDAAADDAVADDAAADDAADDESADDGTAADAASSPSDGPEAEASEPDEPADFVQAMLGSAGRAFGLTLLVAALLAIVFGLRSLRKPR